MGDGSYKIDTSMDSRTSSRCLRDVFEVSLREVSSKSRSDVYKADFGPFSELPPSVF